MSPAASPAASDSEATRPVEPRGERVLTGRVVSEKMDKTITVLVERMVRHETYGKYLRRSTKLVAHEERNVAGQGDTGSVTPCRQWSRRKWWRLLAVIDRAAQ